MNTNVNKPVPLTSVCFSSCYSFRAALLDYQDSSWRIRSYNYSTIFIAGLDVEIGKFMLSFCWRSTAIVDINSYHRDFSLRSFLFCLRVLYNRFSLLVE